MKKLFAMILLVLATSADAQNFSILNNAGVSTPTPPSVLLANTGSAILVNTGVKLLVQ